MDDPGSRSASPARDEADDEDFSNVAGTGAPAIPGQYDRGTSASTAPEDRMEQAGQDEDRSEDSAMIDACAIAARDEAERDGGYAEVRQMEAPRENRRGYSIDGDGGTSRSLRIAFVPAW